jgi:hypothetical protein
VAAEFDPADIFTSVGRLPFNMRKMFGKITGMLTCAAADFPDGGWPAKDCSNNLKNGLFVIFTGLRKGFVRHVFDKLMVFCRFNCTVFKNGSKTNP